MPPINEKGEGTFRARFIEIIDTPSETTYPATDTSSGAMKVSGAKLYISNNKAWNLVTSA